MFIPTSEGFQILLVVGGGDEVTPIKKSMKIELACKKWDPHLKNWPRFSDLKILLDTDLHQVASQKVALLSQF